MKKFVSLFLVLTITFSCIVIGISNINNVYAVDYSCGDNTTWYLDTNSGLLTISGTGRVDIAPWRDYANFIKNVTVEEGITQLCDKCFSSCTELIEVSLPSTLKLIGHIFFGCGSKLESIDFPNGSNLYYCTSESNPTETCPYFTKSEGPIYIGSLLCGYSGEMPENYTLEIKEGTLGIARSAFNKQTNLVDVIAPDSLYAIGPYSFSGTTWYNNLSDGPVYLGKSFFTYKGNMSLEDMDFIIADGTKGIASRAFYSQELLTTVVMPDTVEFIGDSAFAMGATGSNSSNSARLKEIYISKNTKYLGEGAFSGVTNNGNVIDKIIIPSSVEYLGSVVFGSCPVKSIIFEEGFKFDYFPYRFISGCRELTELIIPDGIKTLNSQSIYSCRNLVSITVPSSVVNIAENAFQTSYGNKPVIYCYYGSTAHHFAENNGYEYVLINTANFAGLKTVESTANNLNRNLYTTSSLFVLDSALAKIDYNLGHEDQDIIDNLVAEINAAINSLEYLPADYSKVNEAVEKAKNIDKALYTYESQLNLYKVLSNIDYTYNITYQDVVDAYVSQINGAISNLNYVTADYSAVIKAIEEANSVDKSLCSDEYISTLNAFLESIDYTITVDRQKEVDAYVSQINSIATNVSYKLADYTSVKEAISEAEKVDRDYYNNVSLTMLDNMIEAVDYSLDVRYQGRVEEFAKGIHNSIKNLEYKEISLKDEPTDIIVSATSLQINPRAKLTVDVIDPSEYELANYGLWGSIKNINYFDINLVLADSKIQPDGIVKVKIGLPANMIPSKCRIYHVTDDPIDPLVRFTSTLDGNYIVFETTHFSEFALIEIDEALENIEIAESTKRSYNVGDKILNKDISVIANLTDGTSSKVENFVFSAVDMNTPGDKTVTVFYEFKDVIKSAKYSITVSGTTVVKPDNSEGEKDKTPNNDNSNNAENSEKALTKIKIVNMDKYNGKTLPYKSTVTLYANVENSAGKQIYWFVNGKNVGEGESCTFSKLTKASNNIYCTTFANDGTVVESEHETIKISTGFFSKIKAFFQQLFGSLPVYNQK